MIWYEKKNHRKLKSLIVLFVFFSSISFVMSQNDIIITDNKFSKESVEDNTELNQESDSTFTKLNFYQFDSGTISQLPSEDSIKLEITLLGIFLILDVSIVIKRYTKLHKSEDKEECINPRLNNEISEQEEYVLTLIQDYLSKNRYLEVEKIVQYLNSQLSKSESYLNKNGLEVIITNLIKKNIVVNGSKLTQDEILDNPNRLLIYNTILNNPGIHLMNIINLLGMSIFLVKWHLDKLLKFNFIQSVNVDNRVIYFDRNISENKARFLHFMNRKITMRIVEYLQNRPKGCPKYRISKDLKIHPSTTTKYVQKLEKFEILSKEKHSNKILYILNSSTISK